MTFFPSFLIASSFSMIALISMTAKVCLILLIATVVTIGLRNASAALRHLVWTTAIALILILPVASTVLPAWDVQVPADTFVSQVATTPTPATPALAPTAPTPPADAIQTAPPTLSDAPAPPAKIADPTASAPAAIAPAETFPTTGSTPIAQHSISALATADQEVPVFAGAGTPSFSTIIIAIWIAGVAFVLIRLFAGLIGIRRIVSRATLLDDPATTRIRLAVQEKLGLAKDVQIRRTNRNMPPFTAGFRKPVVVIPESLEDQSADRLQVVLLHELAHVKRYDWLTQIVGQIAVALHWFNPLVWYAHKRQQAEQEMACDNEVLVSGTSASTYASNLLDIVRDMRSHSWPVFASTAMARTSTFEGRVLAILDSSRMRNGLYPVRAAGTAALLALLMLPIAAMRPVNVDAAVMTTNSEEGTDLVAVSELPSPPAAISIEPRSIEDATTASAPSLSAPGLDVAASMTERALAENKLEPVADSPAELGESTVTDESDSDWDDVEDFAGEVLADDAFAVEEFEARGFADVDTTKLFAMIRALGDEEPEVRETAIYILGEMEDPRAIDALSRILINDPEPEIRAKAAWALGEIEDARAVPALTRAVTDESAEVRKNAVWALGELESEDALAALAKATSDPDPKVRKSAVWAIGEIESPQAVGVLTQALKDSDGKVRRSAAWALGEIESEEAVPGLVVALRDTDSEVRRFAAVALAEIESPVAIQPLTVALKDENEEVRRFAAWGLGEMEAESAVGALVVALRDDVSDRVRQNVAWALGEIESSEAVPALVAAMDDSSVEVRRKVMYALGELESEAAVPGLIRALSDSDAKIRKQAAWALGELESREAVEPLMKIVVDDESAGVRKAAIYALGEIQDPRAESALLKVLSDDPDKELRKAAAHAISELD